MSGGAATGCRERGSASEASERGLASHSALVRTCSEQDRTGDRSNTTNILRTRRYLTDIGGKSALIGVKLFGQRDYGER